MIFTSSCQILTSFEGVKKEYNNVGMYVLDLSLFNLLLFMNQYRGVSMVTSSNLASAEPGGCMRAVLLFKYINDDIDLTLFVLDCNLFLVSVSRRLGLILCNARFNILSFFATLYNRIFSRFFNSTFLVEHSVL